MPFDALHRYIAADGRDLIAVSAEEQGSDYEAGLADLDGERWRVRTARITPSKPGAFVAVWRRTSDGATAPFPHDDPTAGLLVLVAEEDHFGAFRFPITALIDLGVYASGRSAGKRGFRLYPAWCRALNPQAERTRTAQAPFFAELR